MAELKPCPFCGKKVKLGFEIGKTKNEKCDLYGWFSVKCEYCGATNNRTFYEAYFFNAETETLEPESVYSPKDEAYRNTNDGRKKAIESWNRRSNETKPS